MTVSHVFNQTGPVAAEIGQRVRKAIASLGCAPAKIARALKDECTANIRMLATCFINPFFAEVISGVEERYFQLGYSLILCNNEEDRDRTPAQRLANQIEDAQRASDSVSLCTGLVERQSICCGLSRRLVT
ncbi:MAG: LacI family DNA-binding transcriptional regulator [Rhodospirillales bacterium]|nr:LacI family DNA-binding transcriptional regulator [Rhodospirillales bacterium]